MSAAVSSPRLTDDALLSASTSSLTASLHDTIPALSAADMADTQDAPTNIEPPGDMESASVSSAAAVTPPAQPASESESAQPIDAETSGQDHDRHGDVEMEGTAEPEDRPAQPVDQEPGQGTQTVDAGNENEAASEDEDEHGDEGDASGSEDDDYDSDHREFLEGYKQDISVPGPEELEEMNRRREEETSALDNDRWTKQAFTPLDDPDYTPMEETIQLNWTFDGFHGSKEAPNKSRFRSSEPVTLTNHDGKQYQFSLKVFPRGNDGTEYMSVYLECAPIQASSGASEEDADMTDEAAAPWWEVTAQFGCVMYNPVEPRVHKFQKSHHQFTSINSDFGWPRFAGPWSHIHTRQHLQYRPLLQDDRASFTAYVRLVKDPTRALWYHNQFHQNSDWDSVLKTGYRGLVTTNLSPIQSALISALAIWFEIAPFRRLIESFQINDGLADPLHNFQPMLQVLKNCLNKKQRSRTHPSSMQDVLLDQVVTVLDWYGYPQLPTVFEVWKALEQLIRYEIDLGLQRKPSPQASELSELMLAFYDKKTDLQPDIRPTLPSCSDLESAVEPITPGLDYASLGSTQELASAMTEKLPPTSPHAVFMELPRQAYDPEKRKWKKLVHKVKLNDQVTIHGHAYQMFSLVTHSGELGSGRLQPVMQPRGPKTPWMRWSTRNSSRGSVLPQTYRAAVTSHEGSDSAEASSAVACVVVYLRSDLLDSMLLMSADREPHDVYNPIPQDTSTEHNGDEDAEIVVAAHLSTGFAGHKDRAGIVDTWDSNNDNVVVLSMAKNETIYDMHEKLKATPPLLGSEFCVWPLDMQRDIRQYCPPIMNSPLEMHVATLQDRMNGTHFWVHVLTGDHAEASKKQYEEMARTRAAESLASLKQSAPAPVSVTEHASASSPADSSDQDIVMSGTDDGSLETQESRPVPGEVMDVLPLMPVASLNDPALANVDTGMVRTDAQMLDGEGRNEVEDLSVQLEEPVPPPPSMTYQEPQKHTYVLVKHFYPLRKVPDSSALLGHKLEPTLEASTSLLVPSDSAIKDLISRPDEDATKQKDVKFYRERPGRTPEALDGSSSFFDADITHGTVIITEPVLAEMQKRTLTSRGFPLTLKEHLSPVHLPGQNIFGTGWSSCVLQFGRQHGEGTVVYANGDAFSGRFVGGKRSAKGTMFFANGSNYQGEWKDDQPNGQGTMVYATSGNKYVGPFQDGKQTGSGGVTYWRDASVNENTCRICYVEERNTVFNRCGHMVACQSCGQQVSECPVCRRPIDSVIRVWDTVQ